MWPCPMEGDSPGRFPGRTAMATLRTAAVQGAKAPVRDAGMSVTGLPGLWTQSLVTAMGQRQGVLGTL